MPPYQYQPVFIDLTVAPRAIIQQREKVSARVRNRVVHVSVRCLSQYASASGVTPLSIRRHLCETVNLLVLFRKDVCRTFGHRIPYRALLNQPTKLTHWVMFNSWLCMHLITNSPSGLVKTNQYYSINGRPRFPSLNSQQRVTSPIWFSSHYHFVYKFNSMPQKLHKEAIGLLLISQEPLLDARVLFRDRHRLCESLCFVVTINKADALEKNPRVMFRTPKQITFI